MAATTTLGGRFEVEREVGRGAVGIVYRALDRVTGQNVALKVIALPGVDASEEARFQREGRLLAGLRHPGIVRLVAFGQLDDGQPYLAMEWLDGEDIAARQRRSPLPLPMCLEVAAQIADALAAAHAAGVVHRDVKPSNVILVGSKNSGPPAATPLQSKLVDFGVAATEDVKLTKTGAIIGTPAYMAPEQARGDGEIDARADLYSLGATLFEMIASRPPHVGPTPVAILARLVTTPAPRLSEVMNGVPPELDELLASLLATSAGERPVSAEFVADELRRISSEVVLDVAHGQRAAPAPPPESSGELASSSGRGPQSGLAPISAGGSRLVTSILATHVPKGPLRSRLVAHLRARGAEATELGGSALVAHFGVRRAAGDEAIRALEIGMRLAKSGASVGVATGRSRIDGSRPSGEVVDRAAALARDAARGSVLADATTTELSRGQFQFRDQGDGATLVTEQTAGRIEASGGGAPFVGRDAELAQAVGAFERAAEDKTPVIMTITGAPGIGKTRLRREALTRIAAHPTVPRIVKARAETFARGQALGVAAVIARQLAGVSKTDSLENAMHAVSPLAVLPEARAALARLLVNEVLPALADGRGARDALWLAIVELVLHEAKKRPLVIAIEDAHWADGESLTLLDHVLGRSAGLPLWVIATARPVLWREDPNRFAGRDHVRLELRPLGRRATRAIATHVLGDRVPKDGELVADTIAAQAGGSPLFAEELARLTAQGRDATSAPTIEAAMQVQLDALDDAVRDAASRLSILGLAGWDAGLAALGVAAPTEALRALAAAEIVQEQSNSRFPSTREWTFKHALMREVAYASISEDSLREWHARAGEWLAKMGEDDATTARHFELGGRNKEAARHLERAAARALAAHALADAVSMADKALSYADDKPTAFRRALILEEAWSRLDARAGERDSAIRALEESVFDDASRVRAQGARVRYEDASGGTPETADRLDEVRKSAQALSLVDEEARTAAALATRYAFAGDFDRAEEVTRSLLDLANLRGIAAAAVDAYQTMAVVHQARGDMGLALAARRSAAEAAKNAGLLAREATLSFNVGFALTTMGARDEAREALAYALALASRIGSAGTLRHGQMVLLCFSATFGVDRELDRFLAEPRSTAEAALFGSWVPHDRATLGVLFYRGLELLASDAPLAAQQARTLLRTAAHGYRATEMLDVVPVALGTLAAAELRAGNAEAARDLASEAATLLERGSPSLLNEAPVFLALHESALALGAPDEAKDAIARAIPRLEKRTRALGGTGHTYDFLTALRANAELIAAATRYGLLPPHIRTILEGGPTSRRSTPDDV